MKDYNGREESKDNYLISKRNSNNKGHRTTISYTEIYRHPFIK